MSEENEQKAVFVKVSDSLSEAQNLMSQAQQLMQDEAEKLAQERNEFEEIRKKLDHVHFGKTVKLNVGGKGYKTSLETLCKDPDSMLAAMFSGRFELKPDEEDGAYFIDRDGKLFRYILDYLRKGELDISDKTLASVAKPLLSEAGFFQLRGLEELLTSKPEKVLVFKDSNIITESKQERTLLSFLKDPPVQVTGEWNLLYRATRDGWDRKTFHSRCDGKSPTLVLVKEESKILGGYATEPWQSTGTLTYKCSTHSFLFFLGNSVEKPSEKFVPTSGGGIHYSSSRGPSFGNKEKIDFTTLNEGSSGDFTFKGGRTYKSPSGQTLGDTVGLEKLVMGEMEVFCPK